MHRQKILDLKRYLISQFTMRVLLIVKITFKAATPPCKRSAVKKEHQPYSRLVLRSFSEGGREQTSRAAQLTSSQATKGSVLTSKASRFGEDVKKTFGFELRAFVDTKA